MRKWKIKSRKYGRWYSCHLSHCCRYIFLFWKWRFVGSWMEIFHSASTGTTGGKSLFSRIAVFFQGPKKRQENG